MSLDLSHAARVHRMMIADRRVAELRSLIRAADNVLASARFEPEVLDAIRDERDARQDELDALVEVAR